MLPADPRRDKPRGGLPEGRKVAIFLIATLDRVLRATKIEGLTRLVFGFVSRWGNQGESHEAAILPRRGQVLPGEPHSASRSKMRVDPYHVLALNARPLVRMVFPLDTT